MTYPPTINNVIEALKLLENIPMPEGDHEGEPINSPHVLALLSPDNQTKVINAGECLTTYTRKAGDLGEEPNKRALTELNKHGYPASLNTSQYDAYRLVGDVTVGELTIDISDPVSIEGN